MRIKIELLNAAGDSYGVITVETDLDVHEAAELLCQHAESAGWDVIAPVRARVASRSSDEIPEYLVTDEGVEEWYEEEEA